MAIFAGVTDEFRLNPIEVIAALFVIAGGLSATFRTGRLFWANLWARLRSRPMVPGETLRIVQDVNTSLWVQAGHADDPAMQVNFDGHVTDISGRENRVLGAEISKPLAHAMDVSLSNNHDARREQVLSPYECADIRAVFFVKPVVADDGNPWQTTVVFTDQYGNRHKVKNCVFRSVVSRTPPTPAEPEEFPYEIEDLVEKKVVSVLKAEITRYGVCGRSCGGLGSVHMVYKGQPLTGVGVGGWTSNTPQGQVIVSDPESAALESDNLAALVGYYRGLESDNETQHFVYSLVDRLTADRGYLVVSYFIVAALWKIGLLAEALQKARRDLPEKDTRFFGLSNVLMLLNGLLKYRYPEFNDQMLDEIERLTHGLNEHLFLIPAEIAAIRAARLKNKTT